MPLDVNYIDDKALTDILAMQKLPDNKESYDKVSKLSVRDAFDAHITWNGIIGHTDNFIKVYESLKEAERVYNSGSKGDTSQAIYGFADESIDVGKDFPSWTLE